MIMGATTDAPGALPLGRREPGFYALFRLFRHRRKKLFYTDIYIHVLIYKISFQNIAEHTEQNA